MWLEYYHVPEFWNIRNTIASPDKNWTKFGFPFVETVSIFPFFIPLKPHFNPASSFLFIIIFCSLKKKKGLLSVL